MYSLTASVLACMRRVEWTVSLSFDPFNRSLHTNINSYRKCFQQVWRSNDNVGTSLM